MDKYHRDAVIGIERENERDENYKSKSNPQIDNARTPNNYHIIGRTETYLTYIDKRIKELTPKRKIKDDAVLINSFILGSDGEFFASITQEQQKEFFRDCAMCFAERYGEENIISAVVHMDETNPHMHLNLIPVLDGRLCSKQLFDRKALRELQTDFHEKVGKKWKLQRGKIGSKAEHLDTVAFKLKKMKEEVVTAIIQQSEAQEAIAEAKSIKSLLEDYEKAKSDKLPFFGKNKDAEIIALRTKNEQLQREIKIRSQDQSDLFKQLQEATQVNSRKDTAYRIVTDMMSAYPDEFDALLQKSRTKKNAPTPFRNYTNDKDGK